MLVSDIELLRHIKDEVDFILDTVQNKTKEDVLNNGILFRAVIRSLEIIGEATKKLSESFKSSHPTIEWKKIGRTRDILIHVYFDIDNDIVWDIIVNKIPQLHLFLIKLV